MKITLEAARAELARIEAIGARGACARPSAAMRADEQMREAMPDYHLAMPSRPAKWRQRMAIYNAFLAVENEKRAPVRERQKRKRQRAAAMLLARIRKVRGNDPEWAAIAARAEAIEAAP